MDSIPARLGRLKIWILLSFALVPISQRAAEAESPGIKVLLVTGGHGFSTNAFLQVFKDNPQIRLTHAEHAKTNVSAYERRDLLSYDVVVLYDMPKAIAEEQKKKFLALFEKGIGLVVLHHALVSYQHWPDYERIIGGRYPEADGKSGVVTSDVGYQHDVNVPVKVLAKDHPITAGIDDFVIRDEIYWGFRVGADVTPILTTTNPKSGKPLAWTRTEGKSRVFYLQLGHGPSAYTNSNFRALVGQAMRWAAKSSAEKSTLHSSTGVRSP